MHLILKGLSIISVLLLFVGCTRDEASHWREYQNRVVGRLPAQTLEGSRPRCFKDRFKASEIQAEINKMEAERSGGKSAPFAGADFTIPSLPLSSIGAMTQKSFLDQKKFPYWFKLKATQKDCKDLACVVNALYERPGMQGLLHHWFYLKTGYAMSTLPAHPWYDNGVVSVLQVPGYSDEAYLFDEDEWKGWWLQANLLPKSMLWMPSLKSVHRVPHGHTPADWKISNVCGWALGYWSDGIVLLGDMCLPLSPSNPFNSQTFFYESTTHEFGHRLSSWNFATGGRGPATAIEDSKEFLALSGWHTEELVPRDGGAVMSRWAYDTNAEFVSLYSRSSPAEDFADSVGHFRTQPEDSARFAPKKYAFIKHKVFADRGYTAAELKEGYLAEVKRRTLNELNEWSSSCLVSNPTIPVLSPILQYSAGLLNISLPIGENVKACLQGQFAIQIKRVLDDLRYDEPEACAYLDKLENSWFPEIAKSVAPEVLQYFKASAQVTDLIAGVKAYRSALLNEFDERATFLSCAQDPSSEECYQKKLVAESNRLYQKFYSLLSSGDLELAKIEKARFESQHVFADALRRAMSFYQELFVPHAQDAQESALNLWRKCANEPVRSEGVVLLTEPYSGGSQYLAPSMLRCMNEGIQDAMIQIRSRVLQEKNLDYFSPESKFWINQQILFPYFKVEWDREAAREAARERDRLALAKDTAMDAIFGELITKQTGAYSYLGCKKEALSSLRQRLGGQEYRYLAIDPELDRIGDQVCEQVRAWIVKPSSR